MKTITIAINVAYYISLFFMYYKIFIISMYILKRKKEDEQKQISNIEKDESLGINVVEKKFKEQENATDIDINAKYIRKQSKQILIVIVFIIIVIFIKGFII